MGPVLFLPVYSIFLCLENATGNGLGYLLLVCKDEHLGFPSTKMVPSAFFLVWRPWWILEFWGSAEKKRERFVQAVWFDVVLHSCKEACSPVFCPRLLYGKLRFAPVFFCSLALKAERSLDGVLWLGEGGGALFLFSRTGSRCVWSVKSPGWGRGGEGKACQLHCGNHCSFVRPRKKNDPYKTRLLPLCWELDSWELATAPHTLWIIGGEKAGHQIVRDGVSLSLMWFITFFSE